MTNAEILQSFCLPKDQEWRCELHNPFVQDGYWYATDGVVIVRFKTEGKVANTLGLFPKDLAGNFFKLHIGDTKPLPAVEVKENEVVCEDCFGNGQCSCDCNRCELDCEECDGIGKIKTFDPEYVEFANGVFVSGERFIKLKTLPNLRFYSSQCQQGRFIPFEFDGGQGAIMPVTLDESEIERMTNTSGT